MFGIIFIKWEGLLSIVIKTIGKQQYAYYAYRNGDKVIHKYLGNITRKNVKKLIEEIGRTNKVPQQFYHLFWDVDPDKIDIRKNSRYIIERILEIGDIDAFRWIQEIYPTRLILETCNTSRKISEKSRIFWQIWLEKIQNVS